MCYEGFLATQRERRRQETPQEEDRSPGCKMNINSVMNGMGQIRFLVASEKQVQPL
jgi:hypothetical protein